MDVYAYVWVRMCVCVCFAHLCLCALFIYSRTIAHRANVICCIIKFILPYPILSYLILSYLILSYLILPCPIWSQAGVGSPVVTV